MLANTTPEEGGTKKITDLRQTSSLSSQIQQNYVKDFNYSESFLSTPTCRHVDTLRLFARAGG